MNAWAVMGAIIVIGLSVGIVVLLMWFRRDWQRALAAAEADCRIVQTARGPIQYARYGTGPVVLTVHGWGGGGAGGYNMFRFLADCGFTVLSVTRPGYMHTPLSVGETMGAQADALAALLDVLSIPCAAVLCGSGGGPASLLFAMHYPERCWALGLISALTGPEPARNTSRGQDILEKLFNTDFFVWLIATFFWRQLVESGMGELNADIKNDPAKMANLRRIINGLILTSASRSGMDNDMLQWRQNMPAFPFAEIKVPTLIIHSRNDKSVPYAVAERTMRIPNAQIVTFEDGGHTCYIVHSEISHPATVDFLKAHEPSGSVATTSGIT